MHVAGADPNRLVLLLPNGQGVQTAAPPVLNVLSEQTVQIEKNPAEREVRLHKRALLPGPVVESALFGSLFCTYVDNRCRWSWRSQGRTLQHLAAVAWRVVDQFRHHDKIGPLRGVDVRVQEDEAGPLVPEPAAHAAQDRLNPGVK